MSRLIALQWMIAAAVCIGVARLLYPIPTDTDSETAESAAEYLREQRVA